MLKRSLALGALMAFVITGSAMAADDLGVVKTDTVFEDLNSTKVVMIASQKENVEGDDGRYAVIGVNGANLTVKANSLELINNSVEGTSASRLYGIATGTANTIDITGNTSIKINASEATHARAVRANNGGTININGDLDISANAVTGITLGLEAWYGANIDVTGTTNVVLKSETGRMYGVQNFENNGGVISFGKDFSLKMENGKSYTSPFQGVLSYMSTTNFNGLAIIHMINNSEVVENVCGVDIMGDAGNAYNTYVNFNNDAKLIIESVDKGVALSSSGYPCAINFNGKKLDIKVAANNAAIGIISQYSANINAVSGSVLDIDVSSITSDARGIMTSFYANSNGNINILGNVNIKAKTSSDLEDKTAIGVFNYASKADTVSSSNGKVFIGGDLNVVANNLGKGLGIGVLASGDYAVTDLKGNVSINASHLALCAQDNATLNAGSSGKELKVLNGNIEAHSGGIVNITADSVFDGTKTQFIATDGGSINLAGGNMSGVLNIANGSKVNLTGATFTANDLSTGIVGGGKLVLTDSGVLSTTADQIFTKADTVGSDFVGNAITDTANKKVDFVSGTVSLTDKEYNFDFVQSAVDTMQKHNSSKTNVVMTGTLVGGVEDNRVTVDEAAGLGNDVALDKVTAESEGNLLVGSTKAEGDTVEEIEIKDSVANGFNVDSLELAAGSNGMVITNDKEVTLGGSDGGSVITVEKDAEAKVNVVVGTDNVVDGASKTNGTLNIGNALANADTEYTLNGSVTVNADSTLNTKGNTTITDDIELNGGTVNAVNGKLEANTIVVNEGTNTITGNVSGIFSAQQGTVTNIGTDDASASTSFESVNLNGSTICFDPAWDKAAGQHGMKFDKNVNGNVQIARNNYVAIGTSDTTAAKAMFEKTGLKFGEKDITAVLYIAGNQKLEAGKGSISIDGGKAASGDFGAATAGSFNAAANSLTMVDGSKINGNNAAALSGVTSSTVDEGAKLYIDGAKKGETYHVIAGADKGWADKNIISDNSLLELKGENTSDNKFDVTASLKKVNDVYGNKVIIANVVDNALDKHETSKAADFFNAAVNNKVNASSDAQISALNSAGAMSELAGVAHSTYAVSNILTDAVADHVSLSSEFDHDSDIWAHYVHNKENVKGLPVANFGADYDAKYNGIVVGGDFYKKDNVVAGAALTYVDGSINGNTLAARTENDAEYYGVSVYGSVTNDDNAVIGDISYLHGKNEITQHNSGFALTGEPESDAFSVGVRVEKDIETDGGRFVPYAGVRYMHVGTGNYTNSIGMSYDADDANLFLLPVGLKYSAEAKVGGMTIRPVAEVGYVWAMGDTDSAQTVSLNGAADGFGYDVTDEGSYFARIGVEAVSDNVTYGLGYEYQKGDSVKANKWMANLNFNF